MMDEGVIKFQLERQEGPAPDEAVLRPLIAWRERCYRAGLIGVYPENNIGYGNISLRHGEGFIISGTQTGAIEGLGPEGYTEVIEADVPGNRVVCRGPVAASSESLTHAMLYAMSDRVRAVIHIHNDTMWERLLGRVPTTAESVPYGTPEMAAEIERLWNETELPDVRILDMAGHQGGIITVGESLDQAGEVLWAWRERAAGPESSGGN